MAERLGQIPQTRLHKLVFLIDLEHFLRHGRTVTDAPWVRQKYGPMTKALLPALREMNGYELVERRKLSLAGWTVKLVERGPTPRFSPDLTEEERETAEFVLQLTRNLGDDEVRELAYATTPMQNIRDRERQIGRELIDVPIDFHHVAGDNVGSPTRDHPDPEAYRAFKAGQLKDLEDLRDRALSGLE